MIVLWNLTGYKTYENSHYYKSYGTHTIVLWELVWL